MCPLGSSVAGAEDEARARRRAGSRAPGALTSDVLRANPFVMRGAFSLKSLAAALLLVMAALLVPTGNASAHQGHHPASAQAQKHAAVEATADKRSAARVRGEGAVSAFVSADVRHDRGHCTDAGKPAHAGGCCTIACHAALAAPALSVDPCREPPSLADDRPEQALAGLSGVRDERPPKLG